jgi:hypothetical protein
MTVPIALMACPNVAIVILISGMMDTKIEGQVTPNTKYGCRDPAI